MSNSTSEVPFRFHWLTVSYRGNLHEAFDSITASMRCIYEDKDKGGLGYQFSRRFANGAVIFSSPELEHMTLSVPGSACDVIDPGVLLGFMQDAVSSGGHITRIDVAFDNLEFQPAELWNAVKLNLIETKANRDSFRYIESVDHTHDSVYIGSRKSERMLRAYNERGFTRVELELKGLQAARAAGLFLSRAYRTLDELASELGLVGRELVRSFLKVEADFWQFFMSAQLVLGSVRQYADIKRERLMNWISRQVSAALAALVRTSDAANENLLMDLLDVGHSKKSFYRYLAELT